MTLSIEDHIATVFDAAVAYVRAREATKDAEGCSFADSHAALSLRWHDLQAAVNRGECRVCDEGSCPGILG